MPKPYKIKITAEPIDLIADGKSKSIITIELLDTKGNPTPANADTEVKLNTTGGALKNPVVKIPKGKEKAETVLTSSTKGGKINLTAKANGQESITINLNLMPARVPAQIRVSADPVSIVADGASKSTLTVKLLDRAEQPIAALSDLVVELFAAKGKLAQPTITIPKGETTAKTFLTSSLYLGSVRVSAHAEGLPQGKVVLNFKKEG